ncbi:MAG: HAD-IA family hydrolase [Dehalococcoidia bacterium]|nr:HAD-IA family hydrolase [Dehalococcoidia bacterium]
MEYQVAWKQAAHLARLDAQDLNEVTVQGWYDAILKGLGIGEYAPDLVRKMNQAWNDAFAAGTRALPHTKSVLRRLRLSCRLGIVSNSLAPNTISDLRVAGILDFFQAIVISSDFGKRKPHAAIFLSALDRLGLKPAEAVFVGDNPYEDIFGAQEVGMRAVLMDHPLVERSRRKRGNISPLQQVEVCVEPDAIIKGLEDLIGVLEGWNERQEGRTMPNEITLTGRVVTGLGQGTAFTQLPWARAEFIQNLGVDPYPGTLNIKLEDPVQLASWRGIWQQDGICIAPPSSDFCAARGFKVLVADRFAGAIVFPLVSGYPDDTIEIIAPVHLKRSLGIDNGAVISVKVYL